MWQHQLTVRKTYVDTTYLQGKTGYGTGINHEYDFVSEQLNFNTDNHHLVIGFDYSEALDHKIAKKTIAQVDFFYHYSMRNYSFYAQEDWKVNDWLSLSYGIRHDKPQPGPYAPNYGAHTSNSYKVGFTLSEKDKLYVARNDFYVLPDLTKKYHEKYGNAELLPAYGYTVNVGYSREFSDNNIFSFNWFKSKALRSIGCKQTGPTIDAGHYDNFTNSYERGWNAQWLVQLDEHWSANIGWAHLFSDEKGSNFTRGYYPKDRATFVIQYVSDKWEAAFDGFYFIRRPSIRESDHDVQGWPSDKYGVFNLNVSYLPNKETKVYIKVENIFDKLWAEHTDVIYNGGENRWYSMPGRSYHIGMEYKF